MFERVEDKVGKGEVGIVWEFEGVLDMASEFVCVIWVRNWRERSVDTLKGLFSNGERRVFGRRRTVEMTLVVFGRIDRFILL